MRRTGKHLALTGVLVLAAAAATACAPASGGEPAVTVYKSPTCGCCASWVEHLRENGFNVTTEDRTDLAALKSDLGVPRPLGSCHTAVVEGYVIEGHVPADVIRTLLEERPELVGLAVPGMPVGSPGMEGPNPEPYDVFAFDSAGRPRIFASR